MRPLNAQIRLENLRNNYQILKNIHGGKLLAVVKADAYGHGAVRCAHALADLADGFAVASVEEAVLLRRHSINNPILLLEGVFEDKEYELVDQYRLWPAVCSRWQFETLLHHQWRQPVKVWLKMDSGMHRAGFFPRHYTAVYTALKQSKYVEDIVKFSHFACADEFGSNMTETQLKAFDLHCSGLAGEESLANSAAMLRYPATCRDWGRAGIALYGICPFGKIDTRLKPVMRLSTHVFGEKVLPPHVAVGYGAAFRTEKPTRIGLIACGYADGYPRSICGGTAVAVNGQRMPIIGRVSMDMMTLELNSPHHGVGSEVELWGDVVNINEVAQAAGTIAYEVLCRVKRAKFTYYE